MKKKLVFIFFALITLNSIIGNAESFNEFKATCADIGFKQNTEAFGDCVLELVARSKKLELKKAEQLAIEKQLETERRKENEIAELRHEQQLADQRHQYEMERQQEANENRELFHALIGGATGLANTLTSPPAPSYQPSRINCNTNPGIGGSTSSYSTTCTAY